MFLSFCTIKIFNNINKYIYTLFQAKQIVCILLHTPQCYGYQHLISMCNLEKAGLLRVQEGKALFPFLRKQLKLIPEQIDELVSIVCYVFCEQNVSDFCSDRTQKTFPMCFLAMHH